VHLQNKDLIKDWSDQKIEQITEDFNAKHTYDMAIFELEVDKEFSEELGNIDSLIKKHEENRLNAEIKKETSILSENAEKDAIKTATGAAKDAEENLVTDAEDGFENKVENFEEDMMP